MSGLGEWSERGARRTRCGQRAGSDTEISSSLMFRNWSTDLSTPVMRRSFLSSIVTSWSTRVLKKLRRRQHSLFHHREWAPNLKNSIVVAGSSEIGGEAVGRAGVKWEDVVAVVGLRGAEPHTGFTRAS